MTVFKDRADMGRLFVASDVLITKANRLTVYEAAAFGLPSISVTAGVNWPDDVAVMHVPSNAALMLGNFEPAKLAVWIAERLDGGWIPEEYLPHWNGIEGAALRIVEHIERIRSAAGLASEYSSVFAV